MSYRLSPYSNTSRGVPISASAITSIPIVSTPSSDGDVLTAANGNGLGFNSTMTWNSGLAGWLLSTYYS